MTTGVLVMLVLYAVFAFVLRYTAWGTHIYAVGDDPTPPAWPVFRTSG